MCGCYVKGCVGRRVGWQQSKLPKCICYLDESVNEGRPWRPGPSVRPRLVGCVAVAADARRWTGTNGFVGKRVPEGVPEHGRAGLTLNT